MTAWYYCDSDRNRHGPVSAAELAELHRAGKLSPDTLVWREGLSEWRPWRELSGEVIYGQPPAPAAATPSIIPDASTETNAREPSSPYAPPRASVDTSAHYSDRADDVVHAGFLKRLAAATIDNLVIGVVFGLVAVIAVLAIGGTAGTLFDPTGAGAAAAGFGFIAILYGVPILAQFVYFTWMHASSHQATLGKMAVGIKVVDGSGRQISMGRSFGRFSARFFFYLFTCGVMDLVSAFMSGLTERKQAVHDMVADTVVVDRWAFTEYPERQRRELGTVTVVMLVLLALLIVGYFVLIAALTAAGLAQQ